MTALLLPRGLGWMAAGAAAALVLYPAPARASPDAGGAWQGQSIYQIVTDRFYDGDPSNNNADGTFDPAGHSGRSVHGGDFAGLEQKLDYIQALGATAIWISPVVRNAGGEFHGYAGLDFYQVDPHWGSLGDLQRLVRAAHARGLRVIDDVVVNHGGRLIDSGDAGYPDFKYPPAGYRLRYRDAARQYPPPFDLNPDHPALADLFHNQGFTRDYQDATQVELGSLHGLDDFRTETPYVQGAMENIYDFWIAQAGFDGFRIDTVKHVDLSFWRAWCPAVRAFAAAHGRPDFFMFGEVLHPSDDKCGSYTGTMGGGPFKLDSVLDYPLYFKIHSVFARAEGGTRQLEDHYAAVAARYDPSAQMRLVTFLDNHDQPRFLSRGCANDDLDRLKLALAFLYTARGLPCLYYGTEQGFDGGKDPFDREDMFAGQFEQGPSRGDNFNMTHPLFQLVARLNNFRRLYPALQTGLQAGLWSDADGPGLFAYARRLGAQEILVVLNTSGRSRTLPGRPTLYPPGTALVNLLEGRETITVQAGSKTPALALPAASAKIFIAQSQMLPLDPAVTGVAPAHDSRGIAPAAVVSIQFSAPMDTASVEAAFSTVPPVDGVFLWSPTRDKMSFTPRGSGFPPRTMMEVHIAGTARAAATGNRLPGGFASRFQTGNG